MSHKQKNLQPDPNTVNPPIIPTIPAAPPITMPVPGTSGTNANTSTQPKTIKKKNT